MNCCGSQSIKRRVLWTVLWINAVVFGAQLTAAIIAHSNALLADSFDMIGDVFAYALTIFAISRGEKWLAKAALFKGIIIAAFASAVLIDALIKTFIYDAMPSSILMLIFSVLGLIANGTCLWLLTHYRNSDINMRSVWVCARNDIIGNISVLLTVYLVYLFQSRWPDILVGTGLAMVLMYSAYSIIHSANKQLKLLKNNINT